MGGRDRERECMCVSCVMFKDVAVVVVMDSIPLMVCSMVYDSSKAY